MHSRSPRVGLIKGLGSAMEMLPERFDTWMAMRVATTMGRVNTDARTNLHNNLRHALAAPGGEVDDELLDRFVARAFESYGTYWAESAKLPAINVKEMASRFVI